MAGRASRRRCRSAERAPLPGEVVSRRRRAERKEPPEEPPLLLDPRAVLALKPERRLKWLSSALQRLQQGKVQSSSIYDILVHHKFPQDASNRVGSKMYVAVCAHMALFSQKQQRFLETDSKLAQLFKDRAAAFAAAEGGGSGQGDAGGSGDTAEDPQVLMEKLLTLPATEAQEFMATLDDASRDRLEELLEARILARASGAGAAPESKTVGAPAREGGAGTIAPGAQGLAAPVALAAVPAAAGGAASRDEDDDGSASSSSEGASSRRSRDKAAAEGAGAGAGAGVPAGAGAALGAGIGVTAAAGVEEEDDDCGL
eukprot:CAMPEP_0179205858 /NCGR_PEP_ID=MMETSP0796-20121207/102630_1 /TAXON_ID=73915 /ORGANISM="Pyrodinium bahamense, Strain pbaha01" /LENGTH=314 /DNA_ID=CAMNT_0020910749 /DNA_START=172 /DNA_END=1115 /DNA_ORIENTATION=-